FPVLPLLARGLLNLAAHLVEAGEVLPAVLLELTPRHLLCGAASPEQHPSHAHQHDQRKDSKPGSKRSLTRNIHRDDEAEDPDDQADRQHDAPDAARRRHEGARGHVVTLTEIWALAGRQLFTCHQRLAFQDSWATTLALASKSLSFSSRPRWVSLPGTDS